MLPSLQRLMRPWRTSRARIAVSGMALALLGIGCFATAGLVQTLSHPEIIDVQYRYNDGEPVWAELPLTMRTDAEGTIAADVTLRRRILTPDALRFTPDDCIEVLTINAAPVPLPEEGVCDFARGTAIDIGAYLRPGENIISMIITDYGGTAGLDISLPLFAPVTLLPKALVLLGVLVLAIAGLRTMRVFRDDVLLQGVLLWGVLLRAVYLLMTPSHIRGHDVDGHIEYVLYMTRHFLPPPPDMGWETYQPPLYYMLSAAWLQMTSLIPASLLPATTSLQILSFVTSVATLALCAWIAKALLHTINTRLPAVATLVLATLPGWVFFAARINNDTLTLLLLVAGFALLHRWWRHGGTMLWYGCCTIAALATWSKANGLALLPPMLLLQLARPSPDGPLRRMERACAGMVLALTLVAGMYVPRMLSHSETAGLVGNAGNIGDEMRLANTWENLATFDPAAFVLEPFNSPWEGRRREFFLEYLYRSAFFGEFTFGDELRSFGTGILLLSLVALALAVLGAATGMLRHPSIFSPLFLTGLAVLAAHLCFRMLYPFSVSQDFRYSPLLALPLAIFAALGTSMGGRLLQRTTTFAVVLLCGFCTLFVLLIAPGNT